MAWLGREQLSSGVIVLWGDGPFVGALNLVDLGSGDFTAVTLATME